MPVTNFGWVFWTLSCLASALLSGVAVGAIMRRLYGGSERLLEGSTAALVEADRREQSLRRQLEEETLRADTQQRRADEFFGIIEGVEKEAQTWRGLYRTGMAQAGNAQTWLFRDLSAALRIGNSYGARLRRLGEDAPPMNASPGLTEFLKDFEVAGDVEVPRAPGKEAAERIQREISENSAGPASAESNVAD